MQKKSLEKRMEVYMKVKWKTSQNVRTGLFFKAFIMIAQISDSH